MNLNSIYIGLACRHAGQHVTKTVPRRLHGCAKSSGQCGAVRKDAGTMRPVRDTAGTMRMVDVNNARTLLQLYVNKPCHYVSMRVNACQCAPGFCHALPRIA